MDQDTHFCARCGRPVGKADRFCMACGAPQGAAPAPAGARQSDPAKRTPPDPPVTGERVLGIVPQLVQVKGFLGKDTTFLNLVVTNQRLLLAHQPESLWDRMDALEKDREKRFPSSGLTWREFLEAGEAAPAPWEYYRSWPPERILAEQPGNFAFALLDVALVTVTLSSDPQTEGDTLVIQHQGQFHEFFLPWGNGREAGRVLRIAATVQIEEPPPGS